MNLPRLKTLTQAGGRLDNNLILEFAKFCTEAKKANNNVWSNRS